MSEEQDNKIQNRFNISFAVTILVIVTFFGLIFGGNTLSASGLEACGQFYESPKSTQVLFSNEKQIVDASNEESSFVHIGGKPIGIAISAGGLIVMGDGSVKTELGDVYPSRNLVQIGDVITKVNSTSISSIYELKRILNENKDNRVVLTIERRGESIDVNVNPATERITGQKKLGLALKEDVGGVGTLTFVTENGGFAALGHYINDAETGLGEELDSGNIYNTSIESVEKGEIGKAGGLVASVNRLSTPIGKIKANTNIGLYGEYSAKTDGALIRIATKGEAKPGHAQVLTTVEGDEPKFYDIEIVKVISQTEPGDKGMVILVNDKELLEKTGGIVQGMSGSPIVQNGVLIGAVTHVFIQDPTRGYAVHARFMFDEAEKVVGNNIDKTDNLTDDNFDNFNLAA
ncbi:MAG: SpoIVB peptidase [Clostridia bacterium]|nr:SpoIVB peptidase [Clostridia bacterium]